MGKIANSMAGERSPSKRAKAPAFTPRTQQRARDWDRAVRHLDPSALERKLKSPKVADPDATVGFWEKRWRKLPARQQHMLMAVASCVSWRDSAKRKRLNDAATAKAEKGRQRKTKSYSKDSWPAVRERNATSKDTADLVLTLSLLGYAQESSLKPYSKATWRDNANMVSFLMGLSDGRSEDESERVYLVVRDRFTRARKKHGDQVVKRDAPACWRMVSARMRGAKVYVLANLGPRPRQNSA